MEKADYTFKMRGNKNEKPFLIYHIEKVLRAREGND